VNHGSRTPHLFLPLNTRQNLPNHLQQAYKVSELDWWNACLLEVEDVGSVRITATPAQHFSGRGLFDRNASLWASWAMEGLHPVSKETGMKASIDKHDAEPGRLLQLGTGLLRWRYRILRGRGWRSRPQSGTAILSCLCVLFTENPSDCSYPLTLALTIAIVILQSKR